MDKFTNLTGTAVPMPLTNIDTDMMVPKQFLKTIKRTGMGKIMFFDARYNEDGSEIPEFVLNQAQYRDAKIIVAGDNFGCGSSREHAPWALLDFGVRCLISTSFADIFSNNCSKNGILLITLPKDVVDDLMQDANQAATLTVDLETQTITRPDGRTVSFETDDSRRHNLLNGIDDIAVTMKQEKAIDRHEARQRTDWPWI
jgi:3-isopropylmalate/(R)-2-methylmalate dehydratase small subunit